MKQPLVVWGKYVVTDPDALPAGGLLHDGAVVVSADRIVDVATIDDIRHRYPEAQYLGSDTSLVFPGFVNTHHHGWGVSNYQMGAADEYLELWLSEIWSRRPVDAYLDCLWADMRNIRSGVTTVLHNSYPGDFTKYAEDIRAKLNAHKASGIRSAFAVHVMDKNTFVYGDDNQFIAGLPPELQKRVKAALAHLSTPGESAFFELSRSLCEQYDGHSRISVLLGPVAGQWCSDALLARVRGLADEMQTGIAIHCVESPLQRQWALQEYDGLTQVEHLASIGLLKADVALGHAGWLTERDMDICADVGASVCHNPSSNLRLRVGILPAVEMLSRGVNVSIGLDGNGLNDDEDMLQELRLAAKLHRLPRGLEFQDSLSSFDVLRMGTVNGAVSANLAGTIGRLKNGYKADMAVLDMTRMQFPYQNPETHVVDVMLQRAKGADVDSVVIDGEVILRDKKFVAFDENDIAQQIVEDINGPVTPQVQAWMDVAKELKPYMADFYRDWTMTDCRPTYAVNSL